MNWAIESTGPLVSTLRIGYQRAFSWEQWVLVSADRHIDSPMSDLKMQKRHLEQAKERGAPILDFGDLFDAMQGRFDKRSCLDELKPENKVSAYVDSIVDDAVSFLAPYAENFAVIGKGNHDLTVCKNNGTDMVRRTVEALGREGSHAVSNGYRGWIRFMFRTTGASDKKESLRLYQTHGKGGEAPVTKGVIDCSRRSVYLPDADIVMSGHRHESWYMEQPRFRLSDCGKEYQDVQYHVAIPTYKDEFQDRSTGFLIEKSGAPKPLGAWWIRFHFDGQRVRPEFTRAT